MSTVVHMTRIIVREQGIFAAYSAYYQPAAHEARGQLVLRLLCRFHICISGVDLTSVPIRVLHSLN